MYNKYICIPLVLVGDEMITANYILRITFLFTLQTDKKAKLEEQMNCKFHFALGMSVSHESYEFLISSLINYLQLKCSMMDAVPIKHVVMKKNLSQQV